MTRTSAQRHIELIAILLTLTAMDVEPIWPTATSRCRLLGIANADLMLQGVCGIVHVEEIFGGGIE